MAEETGDNNESQDNKKAEEPQAPKKSLPARAGKKPARSRNVTALLALLVAVAAAVGSGYLYLEIEQRQSTEQNEYESLQKQQAQLRAELQTLSEFREELRSDLRQLRERQQRSDEQLKQRLDEQGQRLIDLGQKLESLGNTDRSDWLLAEAEYLLRLANQRLLMGRDIKGAAQMLASADDILVQLDDSALHAVRAAIAEELAALRTAAQFDLEGVYLRLQAAAEQAGKLELYRKADFEPQAAKDTAPADSDTPGWLAPLRDAWHKLSRYIRIENREQEFAPLLSSEQASMLRYSLQLMFEQAQMALLAGNEALYQRSLSRARDSIERYYRLDDRAGEVVAMVDELKAESVQAEVPDISKSLRLLKQYIDSVRWSAANGGERP